MADKVSQNRLYRIWSGIKTRCDNPNFPAYPRYGGRGVSYQNDWVDFSAFERDMKSSYLEHLYEFGEMDTTIDRIDNDGDYTKENCRWATRKEQALNTRNIDNATKHTFNGETLTVREWAERTGIKRTTLDMRLNSYGWSIERAVTTPMLWT